MEEPSDRVVVIGKIGGSFGVKGWVKIASFTDPPANLLDYEGLVMRQSGCWRTVEIEDARVTGKGVLAKLAGVDTPEAARLHTGCELGVRRSELPPLEPGEYYLSDVEGLQAWSKSGEALGRLDHFRSTPGGLVAVVRGSREHWIPFVKERIVSVDIDAGRVVFDWGADW